MSTDDIKSRTEYYGVVEDTQKKCEEIVEEAYDILKNTSLFDEKLQINFTGCDFTLLTKNSNLREQLAQLRRDNLPNGVTMSPMFNNDLDEVYVRTAERNYDEDGRPTAQCYPYNIIKLAVLHEIGHRFDEFYARGSEKLTQLKAKIQSIINNGDSVDTKTIREFNNNKDISDSEEFINAWKKDVTKRLGKKVDPKDLPEGNDGYMAVKINWEDGIDNNEVFESDVARSELFANLFALACMDKNEIPEQKFANLLKAYPETYKVVQKHMIEQGITIKK